jgi:hypothetical protein
MRESVKETKVQKRYDEEFKAPGMPRRAGKYKQNLSTQGNNPRLVGVAIGLWLVPYFRRCFVGIANARLGGNPTAFLNALGVQVNGSSGGLGGAN